MADKFASLTLQFGQLTKKLIFATLITKDEQRRPSPGLVFPLTCSVDFVKLHDASLLNFNVLLVTDKQVLETSRTL